MPAPPRPFQNLKSNFAYTGLLLLFLLAAGVQLRNGADQLDVLLHGSERVRPPIDLQDPAPTIIAVTPEAETAGVRKGDVLVAVNRTAFTGTSDLYVPLHDARPGDVLQIDVDRVEGGATRRLDFLITLAALRAEPPPVGAPEYAVSVSQEFGAHITDRSDGRPDVRCGFPGFGRRNLKATAAHPDRGAGICRGSAGPARRVTSATLD